MYVVLLSYTAPLEEVDYALPDYAKWLEKHFATGEFLAAGRRDSREGCVILTRSMSRAKIEAILCVNPFVLGHLATFEIIEFAATRTAPELHRLNEAMAHMV